MKKVKKLILALAATSLLVSCNGRAPIGSGDQQGDDSSQTMSAGGSSGQRPGTHSQPGGQSGSSIVDQDSIFQPVKESPTIELETNDVVDLIREFHQKAIEATGSSPLEKVPTAQEINRFIANDQTGLLASAMKHNHFTKQEALDLIDATLPLIVKGRGLMNGGRSTGTYVFQSDGMVIYSESSEESRPTWMQVLSDPEFKSALVNTLGKLDLDHLFATVTDMENDEDHPLDLAYYLAMLTGGTGSNYYYDNFSSFKETNEEIERYRASLKSLREKIALQQRTSIVNAFRAFANDETLFPLVRLAKQLLDRGLEVIDLTAVMDDMMTLSQYFERVGTERAISKATAAKSVANLAKLFDNEYLSDADLDGLLNLLFNSFLAYWDAVIANPDLGGGLVREALETYRTEVVTIQKLTTVESIKAIFKLVRAILVASDENAFTAYEGKDVAALAAIVENAYYGLSNEERNSLETIANYLGLSVAALFQDVARYDARTIGSFFENLATDVMNKINERFKTSEFRYYTNVGSVSVVQNGSVVINNWRIASNNHGEGRFTFDGAYNTSEVGRAWISVIATFSDGTKWHMSQYATVCPDDVIGYGKINDVYGDSTVLSTSWGGILEYNYESLADAVNGGHANDTFYFNYSCEYARDRYDPDRVGYRSDSFSMTLQEFYNRIDPSNPYGILRIERDGIKLFFDLVRKQ